MNGPALITETERDGKVFTRNISMLKKYKYVSDSDDHPDIDSSNSTEMNAGNTHAHNRENNTDSIENVDNANNVRCSSRTRNPPKKKIYEGGEEMWYMRWTLDRLCTCSIWTLYMDFLYGLGIYTLYNSRVFNSHLRNYHSHWMMLNLSVR